MTVMCRARGYIERGGVEGVFTGDALAKLGLALGCASPATFVQPGPARVPR